MNAEAWQIVAGSVLGSGGATWAILRLHLHFLHDGVKEAKQTAAHAHRRIDHLLERRAEHG